MGSLERTQAAKARFIMIIASLRKAIAQFALAHLLEGWTAPETDLLCEAGLLPQDTPAKDRVVSRYCLPSSLSSYEVAERALWHAAQSLREDRDEQMTEMERERLPVGARG